MGSLGTKFMKDVAKCSMLEDFNQSAKMHLQVLNNVLMDPMRISRPVPDPCALELTTIDH